MNGAASWRTEPSSLEPGDYVISAGQTSGTNSTRGELHVRWGRRVSSFPLYRLDVLASSVVPCFDVPSPVWERPSDVAVTAGHDRDLEEHLAGRPRVREALQLAMTRLRKELPGVRFVIGLYRDPEEDWAYPLVVVVPPSEVDREQLRDVVNRIAVEVLEHIGADADSWFSLTIRPMWPESRR